MSARTTTRNPSPRNCLYSATRAIICQQVKETISNRNGRFSERKLLGSKSAKSSSRPVQKSSSIQIASNETERKTFSSDLVSCDPSSCHSACGPNPSKITLICLLVRSQKMILPFPFTYVHIFFIYYIYSATQTSLLLLFYYCYITSQIWSQTETPIFIFHRNIVLLRLCNL